MSDTTWRAALWNLLETLPLRRISARVALSAGLIGLSSQAAPDVAGQPRVPVSPMLTPEATVQKFKGKYVLKRAANSFFVHLAGHRSHSSHRSHGSHSSHRSHSSSSHYSGAHSSHYSSSTSPPPTAPATPAPAPPRSTPQKIAEPPAPRAKPLRFLYDSFETNDRNAGTWRIGVLATPPETFDSSLSVEQSGGLLSVTPANGKPGEHFSGYVSVSSFDLTASTIAVELRRPAPGATTLFGVAIDSENWKGFRVERGQLSMESYMNGRSTSKKIPYSASQHRFLRMRMSAVAPVIVWETSASGTTWNPEYVETANIQVTALHIAISAGTSNSVAVATGPATFGSVIVEGKP